MGNGHEPNEFFVFFYLPYVIKKVFVVIVFGYFFGGGDFSSWWLEVHPSAGDEKFNGLT